MIPKQMLDAFAAKYGGKAQKLVQLAEQLADFQALVFKVEIDFNDVKDAADLLMVQNGRLKLKAAPLLDAMGAA